MNLLEKHFDTAFAAPDGIQKLRELILTLAMQGKLVPQDPNDQPASELLKAIESEKQRLVKEGKIKQPKALPETKPEEVPHELPKSWEWVRLGSISTKLTDGSHNPPKDSGDGYPMLSSQNVNFGKIDFLSPSRYVSEEDFHVENKRTNISPGDVLLTIVASLGRPAVVPNDAPKFVLQRSVAVINTPISPDFLCRQLGSPICTDYYLKHGKGTAQKGIYLGQLSEMIIALPPIAEQHRIVAKIDRLMARCDELEKLRAERNQKRITIHTAALDRLLTAKESNDFSPAWRFITQHFGELYSVKENVAELRKAILQLAVMGKLVPQDPADEPASELLRAIELEKQRLVKGKRIGTPDRLGVINTEELPYKLPKGWEWVILDQLASKIGSGSTPRGGKDAYEIEGIPFLRSQNIWNNGLHVDDVAFISEETHKKMAATKVMLMDLLLNITGASIGRCVIVPDDFGEANVSQHVTIIRCINPEIRRFIHYLLLSPYGQSLIWTRQVGMSREGLSKKVLEQFQIPLPPLAEQHRIVAKIDQLMALCDQLDQQIDAATSKQTTLLNAVMAQV